MATADEHSGRRTQFEENYCTFALKNPMKIPLHAVIELFSRRSSEDLLRVLNKIGNILVVDARNQLGHTAATLIVEKRLDPSILKFILNLPGADVLAKGGDLNRGWTPAHFCASWDATEYLEVLQTRNPDALVMKDLKGRTPLDLAIEFDSENVITFLRKALKVEDAELDENDLDCPGLDVDIYDPSAHPHINPKSNASKLLRYILREAPALLGTGKKFAVFPDDFPGKCPFTQEGKVKGWTAEKAAFRSMKKALKALHEEYPDRTILFFHSLRYGMAHGNLPQGSPLPSKWESDIDMAVICFEKATGMHAGVFFEVKSLTAGRDLAKKSKTFKPDTPGLKAAKQLTTHRQILQKELLGADLGWVKLCLSVPFYPVDKNWPLEDIKNREAIFTEACRNCQIETCEILDTRALDESSPQANNLLVAWLREKLIEEAEPEGPGTKTSCFRLASWCLLHSTGIILKKASENMDRMVLTDPDSQEPVPAGTNAVALLTSAQSSLYYGSMNNPVMIVGGSGTGKTFISIETIKKLWQDGKLTRTSKAVFVISAQNIALSAQVRHKLDDLIALGVVEIVELFYAFSRESHESDNTLLKNFGDCFQEISENLDVNFAVFDQLEDFPGLVFQEREHLLMDMLNCERFELLWLLFNPNDVPWGSEEATIEQFLEKIEAEGKLMNFQFRIRNTRASSATLEYFDSRSSLGAKFIPHSVGHQGLPVHIAVGEDDCATFGALLADIVTGLYHGLGVSLEDMTVIPPNNIGISTSALWVNLVLLEYFSKTLRENFMNDPVRGELMSIAPVALLSVTMGSGRTPNRDWQVAQEFLKKKVIMMTRRISHERQMFAEGTFSMERVRGNFFRYVYDDNTTDVFPDSTAHNDIQAELVTASRLNVAVEEVRGILAYLVVKNFDETLFANSSAGASEMFDLCVSRILTAMSAAQTSLEALKTLVTKFRYISVVDKLSIRGFESDVIIACARENDVRRKGTTDPYSISAVVSRAKTLAVVAFMDCTEEQVRKLWPGSFHDWRELLSCQKPGALAQAGNAVP